MEEKQKYDSSKNQASTENKNIIAFLGGKSTIFVLFSILLIGLIIFVYNQIPFIFQPLSVLFSTVVLPVILAMIGYYLLRPILRMLENARIPRAWGILILILVAAGLLTLLIFLVFPTLKNEFHNLTDNFPRYFQQLTIQADQFLRTSIFASFYESLDINIAKLVDNLPSDLGKTLTDAVGGIAVGVTSFVSALTGWVLSIVTVPFILFYLLKDGEKLPEVFINVLPPRMRNGARKIVKQADHQISSYIQGQILVAVCIGVMVSIGFFIIGMDYALLLGVLAMFTSIVPYLGPLIAITPAVIIAIVTSPFMIVKLAIVWTIVQLIDGKFISPQIMGKSLQIHPVTIIFVLLTAGSLFGVAGVILGIPAFAVLKVIVNHMFGVYKRRYNKYVNHPSNKYEE